MTTPSTRRRLSFATASITLTISLAAAAQPQPHPDTSRELLDAVLWTQRSVERAAVVRQVYQQATQQLPAVRHARRESASLEQTEAGRYRFKPPAIVLDIDETVLDNAAYSAGLVRDGVGYTDTTWDAWFAAAQATAMPGVKDFLTSARQQGFRVVFITNRECPKGGPYGADGEHLNCPAKASTLDNLTQALGYRPAPGDVLLRRERADWDASDKAARRLVVAGTHRIAMLLGDDLNDFVAPSAYQPAVHEQRFGKTWFVLPNPMYGSWETPFRSLTDRYQGLQPWPAHH